MKSGRVGSPHVLGRNDHEKEILIFSKSIQIPFVQKSLALLHNYLETRSSPSGSVVKNLPASVGDMSSIPGSKIPWRRKWQPTPVFLPGKFHGQRSLVGYIQLYGVARVRQNLATTQQLRNTQPPEN